MTWVEPAVVVSVRFLERTASGRLRQPVFVGIRADLSLRDLLRAQRVGAPAAPAAHRSTAPRRGRARPAVDGPSPTPLPPMPARPASRPRIVREPGTTPRDRQHALDAAVLPGVPAAVHAATTTAQAAIDGAMDAATRAGAGQRERLSVAVPDLVAHAPESLDAGAPNAAPLADACGWTWTRGDTLVLSLTHLAKPLGDDIVKADLLRYYAAVSPYLLRALAGRPLVLRRHTDPAAGRAFYQQHVNAEAPTGVGTAVVGDDEKPRFVGGALATLLYLVQLGAVSMDPWHGRVDGLSLVDYAIVDLDPAPDTPFARVVDVARWVHDELLTLGLASLPKTSGASGIHVVVPLPGDTPATAARLLAELVASQVAGRHRAAATVVRTVRARPPGAVYVDYLQNIPGKTVASVYAARATPTLTVSTPLTWEEVTPHLDPRDWTIRTVPPRHAEVGDLWGDAMLRGNDLEALRRVLRSADRHAAED